MRHSKTTIVHKLACIVLLCSQQFVRGSVSQLVRQTLAEDYVIESRNFPQPYPRNFQMTWEWVVPQGRWAVLFRRFDLDPDDSDWLEVNNMFNGSGRQIRYMNPSSVPPSYIITVGPKLQIHFHSDHYTMPTTTGFQIQILYGKTHKDVLFKLSVARKTAKKPDPESDHSGVVIIVGVFLAIFIIVAITAFICSKMKKRRGRGDLALHQSRDAFGVRRNSGVSHTRSQRRESGQEAEGSANQQSGRNQREPNRGELQRSDSRLNWISRAEMTTTIQTAGRTARPNIYTPATSASNGRPSTSRQNSRENGTTSRAISRQNSRENGTSPQGRAAIEQRPICTSATGSSDRATGSTSRRNKSRKTDIKPETTSVKAKGETSGSGDRSATAGSGIPALSREYSDTADCVLPETKAEAEEPSSPYLNVSLLPFGNPDTRPAEASGLDISPPPYTPTAEPLASVCYENMQPKVSPPKQSSETNIYINTSVCEGNGNSSSLNNIFINTVDGRTGFRNDGGKKQGMPGSETESERGKGKSPSHGGCFSATFVKTVSAQTVQGQTGTTISQNALSSGTTEPSVQIVDGYAYIIPGTAQPINATGADGSVSEETVDCSVQTSTSMHLGVIPNAVRASQLANENGYIDFPRVEQDTETIYTNVSLH